uniref:PH domain-containing protein n=1 Tax=Panagrellus redivivus TaxID=6233 RepID=A0A7E4VYS2_PANRE
MGQQQNSRIGAELATIYAPQNSYCYSIDSDADERFKSWMHALSNCFDNVFIAPKEFSLNSDGHDMDLAHLACLEILRKDKSWKYVALLQNHDAVIKTNAELVQIYTWFNGTNDVGTEQMTPHLYDTNLDWSFQALKLFKDSSRNINQNISFTKGFNQCSLSRAAVDYIFDELNLTNLVTNINTDTYGVDEILVSTLNSDDNIGLPGGFTRKCLGSKANVNTLTRHQYWKSATRKCPSGEARHSICLIGVEFLSEIEKWPAMFANKVYPKFDFGGYECMRERLFNRTFYPDFALPKEIFNETTYASRVAVSVRFPK